MNNLFQKVSKKLKLIWSLSQIQFWYDKVLVILGSILILCVLSGNYFSLKSTLSVYVGYLIFSAAFSYSLNAYEDFVKDREIGKNLDLKPFFQFRIKSIKVAKSVKLLILLWGIGSVGLSLLMPTQLSRYMALLTILFGILYSLSSLQLKDKPILGLLIPSLGQYPLPFLVFVLLSPQDDKLVWFLLGWLLVAGFLDTISHRLQSFAGDRLTRTKNWSQSLGLKPLIKGLLVLTIIFLSYTVQGIFWFPTNQSLMILALLTILSMPVIVAAISAFNEGQQILAEKIQEEIITNSSHNSLDNIIHNGKAYLLTRLRSGQIVSSSSDNCLHKYWDLMGKPFLIIEPVMALGESLTERDRQQLVNSLMSLQKENGAWDYRHGGMGPDIDTTSSAFRALAHLSYYPSLKGLDNFIDSETGLYNTFPPRTKRVNTSGHLQFIPQTLEKHFGTHPCVLPNVWLLLYERGQLTQISPELLKKLQKSNGLWESYYYPSPYYSTKLYVELLTSLPGDYEQFLIPTLDALLKAELSSSSMQNAEMVIALFFLRDNFKENIKQINLKMQQLVDLICLSQKKDGSWQGELIWEFLHFESPPDVDANDTYHSYATALCVKALNLWKSLSHS